jgi:hypothetical protein
MRNDAGGFYYYNPVRATSANVLRFDNTATSTSLAFQVRANFTTGNSIPSPTPLARVNILANSATEQGLVIRGAVGQTANLTEWQNSAGTVLSSLNSSGQLSVASLASNGTIPIGASNTAATGLELGNSTGTATTPFIDFHSGATAVDFDARILASGGTGTSGGGTLSYAAATHSFTGNITTNGNVLAGTTTSLARLVSLVSTPTVIGAVIRGAASQTADLQQWQSSTGAVLANISASGVLSAVSKSFLIDHPTKSGMKLRYGSLEGPENGVYVRGRSSDREISLPEYWTKLVDKGTITVTLTPIGRRASLYVKSIKDNKVIIGGTKNVEYFYTVFAERKDISKLIVEE